MKYIQKPRTSTYCHLDQGCNTEDINKQENQRDYEDKNKNQHKFCEYNS